MNAVKQLVVLSSLTTLVLALPWIPIPKSDEEWWVQRHEEYVENSKLNGSTTSVVIFGDSITQDWTGVGLETFKKYYSPLGAANYGIGSDMIENVLWRILNGEVEGLSGTKVCVLKIGTNNFWAHADSDIARGIGAIVDALRVRQPTMKVLILGILPRSDEEMIARVDNVNSKISIMDNGKSIRFFNMRDGFYAGGGVFNTELYADDLLHLTAEGYAKWAEVMDPILREMLA